MICKFMILLQKDSVDGVAATQNIDLKLFGGWYRDPQRCEP